MSFNYFLWSTLRKVKHDLQSNDKKMSNQVDDNKKLYTFLQTLTIYRSKDQIHIETGFSSYVFYF